MKLLRIIGSTALLTGLLVFMGCFADDLEVNVEGTFQGTYASAEGTYSGPLFIDFDGETEQIEAEGTITIDETVVDFTGSGTLSEDPPALDVDVWGTDFTMHVEGKLDNAHLTGSYTFSSDRWGDDHGSVDLSLD